MSADAIARNRAAGGGNRQPKDHLAPNQISGGRSDVGGQVGNLGVARRGHQRQPQHDAEQNHQKRAGARAKKAVVSPQSQADDKGLGIQSFDSFMKILIFPKFSVEQDKSPRHRQNDHQAVAQNLVLHHHGQLGSHPSADQRSGRAGGSSGQVNIAALEIFEGGHASAQSGGKFVGAVGVNHGQPGKHIGGDRNQPAAPGHRIHKAG